MIFSNYKYEYISIRDRKIVNKKNGKTIVLPEKKIGKKEVEKWNETKMKFIKKRQKIQTKHSK